MQYGCYPAVEYTHMYIYAYIYLHEHVYTYTYNNVYTHTHNTYIDIYRSETSCACDTDDTGWPRLI